MAAVNKDPFVYSRSKNGLPDVFMGLVQAGSTKAIKVGEICNWDETTGYFVTTLTVLHIERYLASWFTLLSKRSGFKYPCHLIFYHIVYPLTPNEN